MSNILHVVNSFDPAGAVVRSVNELKRFSAYDHEVIVRDVHPVNSVYGFQQASLLKSNTDDAVVETLFDWADAVLYHSARATDGWHTTKKPSAFVSHTLYHNAETGFHSPDILKPETSFRYDLLAASHIGSSAFMPGKVAHLPALLDLNDPLLQPNFTGREPCVSISKQFEVFGKMPWNKAGLLYQCACGVARPEMLTHRRLKATVVLDNISDGHYGLAGLEAMAMGIPVVVFNHSVTREELKLIVGSDNQEQYPPFVECTQSFEDAFRKLKAHANPTFEQRRACHDWMHRYYNSRRLTKLYWDLFCYDLLKARK